MWQRKLHISTKLVTECCLPRHPWLSLSLFLAHQSNEPLIHKFHPTNNGLAQAVVGPLGSLSLLPLIQTLEEDTHLVWQFYFCNQSGFLGYLRWVHTPPTCLWPPAAEIEFDVSDWNSCLNKVLPQLSSPHSITKFNGWSDTVFNSLDNVVSTKNSHNLWDFSNQQNYKRWPNVPIFNNFHIQISRGPLKMSTSVCWVSQPWIALDHCILFYQKPY
jgi:hypothetical protein